MNKQQEESVMMLLLHSEDQPTRFNFVARVAG
jgi:hypothetical protein